MSDSGEADDRTQTLLDELSARGVLSPSVEATSKAAASQLGIDAYSKKRNSELRNELRNRGLKYELEGLKGIQERPAPNPSKVASDLAKYSDSPEAGRIVARNLSAMKQNRPGLYEAGKEVLSNAATTGLDIGLDFLGAGRNLTHHTIMALGDENIDWNPIAAAQGKEDVAGVAPGSLRKWAEKGDTALQKGLDIGLETAGAPIALLGAAGNAALQKYNNFSKDIDWNKAWEENKNFGKDTVADVFLDAGNLVTFGGGTALKNLAIQGEKAALRSGVEKLAAKKLGEQFALRALTEKVGLGQVERYGSIGGGQQMKELLMSMSPKITEEAVSKVAGEAGEYFGKRGLAVAGQQLGNFEGSKTLRKGALALSDKMGRAGVILKLDPMQREAYLSSIARTKTKLADDARNMLANAMDKLPAEQLEALSKNKKAFKEYLEGFKPGLEGYARRGPYSMKQNIMKEVEAGRITEDLGMQLMKDIDMRFKGLEKTFAEKKFADPVIDHIRETRLFARPGYNVQNVKSDMGIGFMAGAETPRGWAGAKRTLVGETPNRVIIKDIAGKDLTQKAIKDEMKEMGLVGGADRLAGGIFAPTLDEAGQYLAKKTGNLAQKFEYAPKGELVATALTGGLNRAGKKFASKWDDMHKTALYIEFRAQGLPPRAAAQKVSDIAFNYADPGMFPGLNQAVKRVQSFGGWGYKAATRLPKHALANPLKAKLPMNVSRNVGAEAEFKEDKAPRYAREKFNIMQVPDIAKEAATKFLGEHGYSFPEGYGMKVTNREPLTDLMGQGSEVGLGVQGNPALSTAMNVYKSEDQWGQPTDWKREATKVLGGAPLETLAGELDYRTDFFKRIGILNPFESDISTVPERQRGMRQAAKTMGFFTGERFIPTTPLTEAQENAYSEPSRKNEETFKKAMSRTKRLKKKAKDDRR